MQPKTIPERINSKRLILRRIQPEDTQPFYNFLRDDDNVRFMFFTDEQRTFEGAKSMIDWTINSYDSDEPVCIFAIADKVTGDYMGNLGAQPMEGTSDTEFFYTLLPKYRGQGYVTEALEVFLSFLFEEGIQQAVAIIVPGNDASIRVVNHFNARFAGEVEIHGNAGLRYEIDHAIFQEWKSRLKP